jgi:hypothetical protein
MVFSSVFQLSFSVLPLEMLKILWVKDVRLRSSDKSEHVKDAFISLHSDSPIIILFMREVSKISHSSVTKCSQFSPFVMLDCFQYTRECIALVEPNGGLHLKIK